MNVDNTGRRVVVLILVLAAGVCVGAAATLGLEVVKVRQVLVARLENQPIGPVRERSAEFLSRIVSTELALNPAQRALLKKSITDHEGDIVAARESMARSVRAIAQLIYADIRPELTDAQRLRAESFLHKGE